MRKLTKTDLDELSKLLTDVGPIFGNDQWFVAFYDQRSEEAIAEILRQNFKTARPDSDFLTWWIAPRGIGVGRFRREFLSAVELARYGSRFGQLTTPAQIASQGFTLWVAKENSLAVATLLTMLISPPLIRQRKRPDFRFFCPNVWVCPRRSKNAMAGDFGERAKGFETE